MKTYRGLPLLESILLRIDTSSVNGCWEWKGYKDKDGYAIYTHHNKPLKVHRFMYELEYGNIGGLNVLHHCDNPPCVRISHLYEGTPLDNSNDKFNRGRANPPKGEKHYNHYLTVEIVLALRRDYEKSDKSYGVIKEIAERYNVKPDLARRIIRRERWKWL